MPEEREKKKKKGHSLLDLFNILTVQLVHALEYRQPFYIGFSARRLGEKLIFFPRLVGWEVILLHLFPFAHVPLLCTMRRTIADSF